jgi:transposase
VPIKTVEQQSCLILHRARHLFIRQQTAVINSIRAYLAEFGIVAPVGRRGCRAPSGGFVADTADRRLPEVARVCLAALGSQLRRLKAQIQEFDRRIIAWHRSNATSKRMLEANSAAIDSCLGGNSSVEVQRRERHDHGPRFFSAIDFSGHGDVPL